jgi:hypothetical protein
MFLKTAKRLGQCLFAALAFSSAYAQATTFELTQSLTGQDDQVVKVATLEIVQSGNDAVFTLTGSFDYLSDNVFLKELFITGENGQFVSGAGNAIVSAPVTFNDNSNYLWDIRFPTAHNADRFGANDVATWTIKDVSADAVSNPIVKLNGGSSGIVRVTAVSPAPEAETSVLLLAGLSVLGFANRRRKQ